MGWIDGVFSRCVEGSHGDRSRLDTSSAIHNVPRTGQDDENTSGPSGAARRHAQAADLAAAPLSLDSAGRPQRHLIDTRLLRDPDTRQQGFIF